MRREIPGGRLVATQLDCAIGVPFPSFIKQRLESMRESKGKPPDESTD